MNRRLVNYVFYMALIANVAVGQAVRMTSFDFNQDPLLDGWRIYGQSELFNWDSVNGRVNVTWDSRLPNSYFFYPIGYELNRHDSFGVGIDFYLDEIVPGINPTKTAAPFEIAMGFIRVADATGPGFLRGTGVNSPNLVEFDFFPDPGGEWIWGPSLTLIIFSTNSSHYSHGGFYPGELVPGVRYRLEMVYDGSSGTLLGTLYTNGQLWVEIPVAYLPPTFTDFRVDAFAICSYSDEGQWPGYEGSIYARGWVDNVVLSVPPPPVQELAGQVRKVDGNRIWEVSFLSGTNWVYALERTGDFTNWEVVGEMVWGNGGRLTLVDTNPPIDRAFYRVVAHKP